MQKKNIYRNVYFIIIATFLFKFAELRQKNTITWKKHE